MVLGEYEEWDLNTSLFSNPSGYTELGVAARLAGQSGQCVKCDQQYTRSVKMLTYIGVSRGGYPFMLFPSRSGSFVVPSTHILLSRGVERRPNNFITYGRYFSIMAARMITPEHAVIRTRRASLGWVRTYQRQFRQ